MNLGKYIFGFREEYLNKSDNSVKAEQFYSYNMLSVMFFILVALCSIAGIIYGLIIFQNWIFAIVCGLLLGSISFVLLLLVFFLNMTTRYLDLYQKMTNMHEVFDELNNKDFTGISDEMALQLAQQKKMELRERNQVSGMPKFHVSNIITSAIKTCLVLILSCIVANALEIFIFQNKINSDLEIVRNSDILKKVCSNDSRAFHNEQALTAKWTLDAITEKEITFKMIDSYSITLVLDTMNRGLGKGKLLLDFLFAILFLIPFILVRKSNRFSGGIFLKEVTLSHIATSYLFYILAQRKCQQVKQIIEKEDFKSLIKVSQDVS